MPVSQSFSESPYSLFLPQVLLKSYCPGRCRTLVLSSAVALTVIQAGLLKAETEDVKSLDMSVQHISHSFRQQSSAVKQMTAKTPDSSIQRIKADTLANKNLKSRVQRSKAIGVNLPKSLQVRPEGYHKVWSWNGSPAYKYKSFFLLTNIALAQASAYHPVDANLADSPNYAPRISQAPTEENKAQPQYPNKIQQTIDKIKGNANPAWGRANKTGYFINLDQTAAWSFPSTGSKWGTGAGRGVTSLTFGANGSVNGNSPNMFNWSAQFGPIFEHVYKVPGIDRTALAVGIYASLNPLRHFRNGFNIYSNWSGVFGLDQQGSSRFQNVVQAGLLYSFANVNIIPDPVQRINIPEKGFYMRVQPTWLFALDGQLSQSRTQAYLGWAENHYPFSFAVEVGPEFIQSSRRELQTIIGSFFDVGYYFTPKIRAYLRYRPAFSFGGSDFPAAPQLGAAGLAVRF